MDPEIECAQLALPFPPAAKLQNIRVAHAKKSTAGIFSVQPPPLPESPASLRTPTCHPSDTERGTAEGKDIGFQAAPTARGPTAECASAFAYRSFESPH